MGKGGRLRRGGGRLGELLGDAGSGDPAYKGAAGSERRPYLEGAGSGDPAYRGRRGDGLLGDAGSGDPAYKGAAGSESQPYLEGGSEEVDLA